jgi:molybdenum cofactor cytidylyltransferase
VSERDPGRPGPRVRVVVLAAGAARRFGSQKLLARLDGRPLLQHALDTLAAAGVADPIVVLGDDATVIRVAIAWRDASIVVNPEPSRGLASSLVLGWSAALADPRTDAVLVALGDQPRLRAAVVGDLLAAPLDAARPIVAPRYADGGGRNPVRIERSADALVRAASGDRGLGPLLDEQPELVRSIDVNGSNPDVDRPEDLAGLAAGGSPDAAGDAGPDAT